MGKTSWMYRAKQEAKFSSRRHTRCDVCGRSHAVYRKFGLCRVCFRNMALRGEIPGVRKASW